jgi:hypothetical protein
MGNKPVKPEEGKTSRLSSGSGGNRFCRTNPFTLLIAFVPSEKRPFNKVYNLGRELGKGAFSVVRLGTNKVPTLVPSTYV